MKIISFFQTLKVYQSTLEVLKSQHLRIILSLSVFLGYFWSLPNLVPSETLCRLTVGGTPGVVEHILSHSLGVASTASQTSDPWPSQSRVTSCLDWPGAEGFPEVLHFQC